MGSACLGGRQGPWCKQHLHGGIPRSWELHVMGCAWKTACHSTQGGAPNPAMVSSSYLPLYPNMRKRTQNMMHVTPMWMPMMIPVVEVLLFCSSFMQSQGGFSAARRRGERGGSAVLVSCCLSTFGAWWEQTAPCHGAMAQCWLTATAPEEKLDPRQGLELSIRLRRAGRWARRAHCTAGPLPAKGPPCSWYPMEAARASMRL